MAFTILESRMVAYEMRDVLRRQYGLDVQDIRPLGEVNPVAITYCSNPFVAYVGKVSLLAKECRIPAVNNDKHYLGVKADVSEFLRAAGVRVPRHFRTLDGSGFGRYDDRAVEVMEFFPDVRNYEFGNVDDAMQAGRELGKFDKALKALGTALPIVQKKIERRKDMYTITTEQMEEMLDEKRRVRETLAGILGGYESFDPRYVGMFMDDLIYFLRENASIASTNYHWNRQMIHRDFHGNNSLYFGRDFAAVTDFDTLAVMNASIDPAYSAMFFSSDIPRPFACPDEALFMGFLEAYSSENGSVPVGKTTLLDALRREMVLRTAYFVYDRVVEGSSLPDQVIANHVGVHKRIRDAEKFVF